MIRIAPLPLTLASGLSVLSGCFSATQAVDPLPGPELNSVVFADSAQRRSLSTSILLSVSRSEAAAWITRPDRLRVWLADEVEFDGVGGSFRLAWPAQGEEWRGTLTELDADGRLRAQVPNRVSGAPVELGLEVVEEAGFQRVSFTIGPFGDTMPDEVVATGYREGAAQALFALQRASKGEAASPPGVPVVERTFKALETPREGLEAELKFKNTPKTQGPAKP